jgi:hypothetical protein
MPKPQNKERILKAIRKKCQFTYKINIPKYIRTLRRNPKIKASME